MRLQKILLRAGPQKPVPAHAHYSLIAGVALSGARVLRVENRSYNLTPGTFYIVPPQALHSMSAAVADYRAVTVVIKAPENLKAQTLPCVCPYYETLGTELAKAARNGNFTLFITTLEKTLASVPRAGLSAPARLTRARNALEASLNRRIGIAVAARAAGFSRYALIRRFKKELGVTPHALRNIARVQLAKKLLAQGVSAAQCALACGFCDQSHLCRQFRRQMGISPLKYLKS